jgi:hypothetical protein
MFPLTLPTLVLSAFPDVFIAIFGQALFKVVFFFALLQTFKQLYSQTVVICIN